MANAGNQKLKLLYIMEIFLRETDEHHSINASEIVKKLAERGIVTERKSVYRDIDILVDFGMDIVRSPETKAGFYLAGRTFELPELKLLADAVAASKFITDSKSAQLEKKIEQLASRYEAKQLQRQVVVSDRVKTENEKIYYAIDVIYNCIDNNHQMEFQYSEWTVEKKRQLRKNGAIYRVSPEFLLWDNEYYYLVAFDELAGAIRHYRVDKMENAKERDEARAVWRPERICAGRTTPGSASACLRENPGQWFCIAKRNWWVSCWTGSARRHLSARRGRRRSLCAPRWRSARSSSDGWRGSETKCAFRRLRMWRKATGNICGGSCPAMRMCKMFFTFFCECDTFLP